MIELKGWEVNNVNLKTLVVLPLFAFVAVHFKLPVGPACVSDWYDFVLTQPVAMPLLTLKLMVRIPMSAKFLALDIKRMTLLAGLVGQP